MHDIPGTSLHLPPDAVDDMVTALRRVLESGRLILGPETVAFEQACAAAIGAQHAVAVSTGTAALEVILRSLDIAGRSVLVPANTFFATAAAVIRAGATPVLVDVRDDMLLGADVVDAAWRDDTAAVVVVHLGGMISSEIGALIDVAERRGGFLIEDAAQSLGARCALGSSGAIGIAGATSFYPTKIVTSGEGGIISTADDEIARRARIYRDQGKVSFGENRHVLDGYSWRLSELHAAVGRVHLKQLDFSIDARRRIADQYTALLRGSAVTIIDEPATHRWSWYKYTAMLPDGVDRERVRCDLAARGIGLSGEIFASPLHWQPIFQDRFAGIRLPNAERVCAQHICLPISPDLNEEDVGRVAVALLDVVDAAVSRGQPR